MKWFKHLVFLVFFVIVFSFVEIHEKRPASYSQYLKDKK